MRTLLFALVVAIASDPVCSRSERSLAPLRPCAGKPCGAACTFCMPGDTRCNEQPHACTTSGNCARAPVSCTKYDPCAGKTCGSRCSVCAPGDRDCIEAAVVTSCDRSGECAPGTPDCADAEP